MEIKLTRYTPTTEQEEIFRKQQEIINDISMKMAKQIDDKLKQITLTYAVPPIKGEITKGKCVWRGLRLFSQNTFEYTKHWVEQRGVRIGEEIVIDYKIKL
jgi:hypothetical protein